MNIVYHQYKKVKLQLLYLNISLPKYLNLNFDVASYENYILTNNKNIFDIKDSQ